MNPRLTITATTEKFKAEVPDGIKTGDLIRDIIINFGEDKARLDKVKDFKAKWKPVKAEYKRRVTLYGKACA